MEEVGTDIVSIGREIEAYVAGEWQSILEENREKLADAYARAGDMAYGTYLDLLFRPVHRWMRESGLRAEPKLPGDFEISREWGRADQTDQQRWMWSTIHAADGRALGSIVTITHHDHTQFRLPRAPGILALAETGKDAVVDALSARSAEFAAAREASIEIAEYLAGAAHEG
jgi:hypothetical protein